MYGLGTASLSYYNFYFWSLYLTGYDLAILDKKILETSRKMFRIFWEALD
jgi:hypothetical protein